jgi:hypothetical protein
MDLLERLVSLGRHGHFARRRGAVRPHDENAHHDGHEENHSQGDAGG